MMIRLPFLPQFQEPLLTGVKTCTARTKYMGHPGDTFLAFGSTFEILSVAEVPLHVVAALWKEEGCQSLQHFQQTWDRIHPVAKYNPYTKVKLHRFRKVIP
jgi:hypothetical protein